MKGLLALRQRLRNSARQEHKIAIQMGGRRVAGSGSQPGNKGDVKAERWLVEAKQTKGARFTLTIGLWRKIFSEAVRASREPAMVIELSGRSLAVIDYQTFLALKQYLP